MFKHYQKPANMENFNGTENIEPGFCWSVTCAELLTDRLSKLALIRDKIVKKIRKH
ncbi:hypothetical protein C2G38_2083113 [Gigaspora rosea]|uniref:Uncharacterized protein n=1 Tax=Gigaspora rosea TaxID=44941 RepID=A0A397VAD8_9GLOM|nr:hypothetical protein C2G38_2083113 [Gigaspora rosea]